MNSSGSLRIQVPTNTTRKNKRIVPVTPIRTPITPVRTPITTPVFNTSNIQFVGVNSNRSLVNIESTPSIRNSATVSPVSIASSISLSSPVSIKNKKPNVSKSFRNTKNKVFQMKNVSNNKFKPVYNQYKKLEKEKANVIPNWKKTTKRKWYNPVTWFKTRKLRK